MPDSKRGRTRLGRGWRRFREQGILATVRIFVERFVYRSYRCIITHGPAAGPPAPERIGAINFRLATPADLDRLAELEPYNRGASNRRRVDEDHDWLFVACDGERIVATRRATLVIRNAVVSRVFALGPGQFWGADIFCIPEYRSQNIARQLKVFGDRHLAALGYKELVSSIEITNIPSLRSSRAAGRHVLAYVSYVKILFWERARISNTVPAHYRDDAMF